MKSAAKNMMSKSFRAAPSGFVLEFSDSLIRKGETVEGSSRLAPRGSRRHDTPTIKRRDPRRTFPELAKELMSSSKHSTLQAAPPSERRRRRGLPTGLGSSLPSLAEQATSLLDSSEAARRAKSTSPRKVLSPSDSSSSSSSKYVAGRKKQRTNRFTSQARALGLAPPIQHHSEINGRLDEHKITGMG